MRLKRNEVTPLRLPLTGPVTSTTTTPDREVGTVENRLECTGFKSRVPGPSRFEWET